MGELGRKRAEEWHASEEQQKAVKEKPKRKLSPKKALDKIKSRIKALVLAELRLREILASMTTGTSTEDFESALLDWSVKHGKASEYPAFQHCIKETREALNSGLEIQPQIILDRFSAEFSPDNYMRYADRDMNVVDVAIVLIDFAGSPDEGYNGEQYSVAGIPFCPFKFAKAIYESWSGLKSGVVYILLNSSFPKYLKIGMTTRSASQRAKEISVGTGVPSPYRVAFTFHSVDCKEAEKRVHAKLAGFRVKNNREFFEIPFDDAKEIITITARELDVELHGGKAVIDKTAQQRELPF